MKKNHFIYIRGLKKLQNTVMCVGDDGQKTYWDSTFRKSLPFSSGQQVKRSIVDGMLEILNEDCAPITFYKKEKVKKNKKQDEDSEKKSEVKTMGEGVVMMTIDPSYSDMLIKGYWETTVSEIKKDVDSRIKRRSPLSISAMTPLHPYLVSINKENHSFDKRESSNVTVSFTDENYKPLSDTEIESIIKNNPTKANPTQYIQDVKKSSGLFTYDVCIDIRRLFCVNISDLSKEIYNQTKDELILKGWKVIETNLGKCLIAPNEIIEKISNAISESLVDWRITSNQSANYSSMETIALAISNNAKYPIRCINAEISGDDSAVPIIRKEKETVVFTSPNIKSVTNYIYNDQEDVDDAKDYLSKQIKSLVFEYINECNNK